MWRLGVLRFFFAIFSCCLLSASLSIVPAEKNAMPVDRHFVTNTLTEQPLTQCPDEDSNGAIAANDIETSSDFWTGRDHGDLSVSDGPPGSLNSIRCPSNMTGCKFWLLRVQPLLGVSDQKDDDYARLQFGADKNPTWERNCTTALACPFDVKTETCGGPPIDFMNKRLVEVPATMSSDVVKSRKCSPDTSRVIFNTTLFSQSQNGDKNSTIGDLPAVHCFSFPDDKLANSSTPWTVRIGASIKNTSEFVHIMMFASDYKLVFELRVGVATSNITAYTASGNRSDPMGLDEITAQARLQFEVIGFMVVPRKVGNCHQLVARLMLSTVHTASAYIPADRRFVEFITPADPNLLPSIKAIVIAGRGLMEHQISRAPENAPFALRTPIVSTTILYFDEHCEPIGMVSPDGPVKVVARQTVGQADLFNSSEALSRLPREDSYAPKSESGKISVIVWTMTATTFVVFLAACVLCVVMRKHDGPTPSEVSSDVPDEKEAVPLPASNVV